MYRVWLQKQQQVKKKNKILRIHPLHQRSLEHNTFSFFKTTLINVEFSWFSNVMHKYKDGGWDANCLIHVHEETNVTLTHITQILINESSFLLISLFNHTRNDIDKILKIHSSKVLLISCIFSYYENSPRSILYVEIYIIKIPNT